MSTRLSLNRVGPLLGALGCVAFITAAEPGPVSLSSDVGSTVRRTSPSSVGSAFRRTFADDDIPSFASLLAHEVTLKPGLVGIHPRVFVTARGLETLRQRAKTTHKAEWVKVLAALPAMKGAPPPAPGPQERRSQNNVAFAIAGVSLAYAVEQQPTYLDAAKKWVLAAIDYEPWGYTYYKPNVDLAAGHLLYALGWAYDLLYDALTPAERARIRGSLERHATLVHDYFSPGKDKAFPFTQNHNFIPTSGLAVTALALMGESAGAPKWAALARAHHHRAGQLLSPDGYYYESMEYWIFSAPWLVHFLDAWEHATGESLWDRGHFRHWKHYLAHVLLPDGQNVFDFGDIWEGPLTRAKGGAEYDRVFPGGTLQSNYNVLYRVAARFNDSQGQAVAGRYARFGHSNLEEYMTLLWRDPALTSAPMSELPLWHHFADSGLVFYRTSWTSDATAFAFKAGPPEGHRVTELLARVPEWRLDSGHAHPDAGSFIIWARGKYLTGDTGYAGQPQARHHNTLTVDGIGQGVEGDHDVWRKMDPRALGAIRITLADLKPASARIEADLAGAYPASADLVRLRRVFTFAAPGGFTVVDVVETRTPRAAQAYVHSDAPIERRGDGFGFLLGGPPPSLLARIGAPADATATIAPTILTAPGKPGSITEGSKDQRGYELRIETRPATTTRLEVQLRIIDR